MSSCCCKSSLSEATTPRLARRVVKALGVLVPGALWVVMPKCPACVAAYIGVATGLGVSVAMVEAVRWGLMGLCGVMGVWVVLKAVKGLKVKGQRS